MSLGLLYRFAPDMQGFRLWKEHVIIPAERFDETTRPHNNTY
jgi:hypothetical protein